MSASTTKANIFADLTSISLQTLDYRPALVSDTQDGTDSRITSCALFRIGNPQVELSRGSCAKIATVAFFCKQPFESKRQRRRTINLLATTFCVVTRAKVRLFFFALLLLRIVKPAPFVKEGWRNTEATYPHRMGHYSWGMVYASATKDTGGRNQEKSRECQS